ncbi:hypothetical protein PsYK624_087560 [Phanerochaete sordida]|uniref:Uncharacterized protein n=1 Tax=Phanerochaete sordida TaxID=48140 RepID=A0A9P3GCY0_9APHY|nr:hypothetical protein PsYK624_087560 [Phanerochaete sordida]
MSFRVFSSHFHGGLIRSHQLSLIDAGTLRVEFGPAGVELQQEDGAPALPAAVSGPNSKALQEADVNHIQRVDIVVYASTPLLEVLHRFTLASYTNMRSLSVEVVYDTNDSSHIVDVWRNILPVLRSIHDTAQLEHLTLTSPVPLATLRSGWSGSTTVAGLQQPLYSIDHALVRLVDRAPLEHVIVVPPQGETFLSTDWARARSFFPALFDYDMLRY